MNTNFREKFVLLGYTGYIGEAFAEELSKRGDETICLSRSKLNYTDFATLRQFLADEAPTFLINCAGFTGKPNVDACEKLQADTVLGNVVLPQTIADACEAVGLAWGQVSSGCIFSGAKLRVPGQPDRVEKELMLPEVRKVWESKPEVLEGFNENDPPNFSFRDGPCSFYSGTKALGEEVLTNRKNVYIWRLRIPFDHKDNPRNYLSKLQNYSRIYNNVNSLSHRSDFVKACLELWSLRTPTGIYNVTNSGFVTTSVVANRITEHLKRNEQFKYFEDNADFYEVAVAPRSNTILNIDKLLETGVKMRSVDDALLESLQNWNLSVAPCV